MKTKYPWSFGALLVAALVAVAAKPALATTPTISVQGNYTIGTSGLTGNAPTIIDELTPNTGFTLSVPTSGSTTSSFLQFDPAGSSGIYNSGNCWGFCDNSHNNIVSETVTAMFHFTQPTGDSATATVTGEYYANYNGSLDGTQGGSNPVNCGDTGTPADCIVWGAGDPITATFGNGDVLTLTLDSAHDWDITSDITYSMTTPVHVPEPASLALLGTAVLGFGAIRRHRNRNRA